MDHLFDDRDVYDAVLSFLPEWKFVARLASTCKTLQERVFQDFREGFPNVDHSGMNWKAIRQIASRTEPSAWWFDAQERVRYAITGGEDFGGGLFRRDPVILCFVNHKRNVLKKTDLFYVGHLMRWTEKRFWKDVNAAQRHVDVRLAVQEYAERYPPASTETTRDLERLAALDPFSFRIYHDHMDAVALHRILRIARSILRKTPPQIG